MKRRLALGILLLCLLLGSSGCGDLFSDTYYSEKDFQGNQGIDLDSDVEMVQNYAELRRFVFNLVNTHSETTKLHFAGYTGNVVSDLASVCNAVSTESAYGAYCVEYISYDLTQIVSYYEADITISYRYTPEELASMQTTTNLESYSQLLAEELAKGTERLVVKVNNGSGEESVVTALIRGTVRNYPMAMSYCPEFSLKIYKGNSSQKIYELTITYDEDLDNQQRIAELKKSVERGVQNIPQGTDVQRLTAAAEYLSQQSTIAPLAGTTAYDALVTGQTNSEGISSAMKALCDRLEIECMIVTGKLGREPHFWNIVKADGFYYHMDVSALQDVGTKQALFQNDAEQQIQYWWDQSQYPDCTAFFPKIENSSS